MGRGPKRKKQCGLRRPEIDKFNAAISSVDIAKAAAAAREGAAVVRSPRSEEELLVGVYLLSQREASVGVFGSSRQALAKLVGALKVLKVSAAAVHAASREVRGSPVVVAVCDDAVGSRLFAGVGVHADSAPAGVMRRREACAERWESCAAQGDSSFLQLARARCELATRLAAETSAEACFALRARLEVALNAPSAQRLKETRRKMVSLGMLGVELPRGFEFGVHAKVVDGAYREVARTRYLDRRVPEVVSEAWLGNQRAGARADAISRRVARAVRESDVAAGWRPRREIDDETWGGPFGKACAHNEVCLHCARPFAPLEVVNTRTCSRARPAPGNEGTDGCLEFLRIQCRRKRRSHTVWDRDNFLWISPTGVVDALPKARLLSWPLPRIEFVIPALRDLTLATGGRVPTRALIRLVDVLLDRGIEGTWEPPLKGPRIPRLVVAFVLGGDLATWRRAVLRRRRL